MTLVREGNGKEKTGDRGRSLGDRRYHRRSFRVVGGGYGGGGGGGGGDDDGDGGGGG